MTTMKFRDESLKLDFFALARAGGARAKKSGAIALPQLWDTVLFLALGSSSFFGFCLLVLFSAGCIRGFSEGGALGICNL